MVVPIVCPPREIETSSEPAALSVTSKLTPALAVTVRRDDRRRVERRRGARDGGVRRAPGAARRADVQAGSMLSAPGLCVRSVALVGKLHVPESQPAEIV